MVILALPRATDRTLPSESTVATPALLEEYLTWVEL